MEYRELLRQQELAAQRREHGPAADASERSLRLYPGSALREVVAASAHPLNLEPLLLTLARDGNEELRRRFGEAAGEVVLISKALGYGAVVGDLQVVAGRRVVDARDGFAYPAVASSSSAGAAGAAGDEKKKKKNKADATASVVAAGKGAKEGGGGGGEEEQQQQPQQEEDDDGTGYAPAPEPVSYEVWTRVEALAALTAMLRERSPCALLLAPPMQLRLLEELAGLAAGAEGADAEAEAAAALAAADAEAEAQAREEDKAREEEAKKKKGEEDEKSKKNNKADDDNKTTKEKKEGEQEQQEEDETGEQRLAREAQQAELKRAADKARRKERAAVAVAARRHPLLRLYALLALVEALKVLHAARPDAVHLHVDPQHSGGFGAAAGGGSAAASFDNLLVRAAMALLEAAATADDDGDGDDDDAAAADNADGNGGAAPSSAPSSLSSSARALFRGDPVQRAKALAAACELLYLLASTAAPGTGGTGNYVPSNAAAGPAPGAAAAAAAAAGEEEEEHEDGAAPRAGGGAAAVCSCARLMEGPPAAASPLGAPALAARGAAPVLARALEAASALLAQRRDALASAAAAAAGDDPLTQKLSPQQLAEGDVPFGVNWRRYLGAALPSRAVAEDARVALELGGALLQAVASSPASAAAGKWPSEASLRALAAYEAAAGEQQQGQQQGQQQQQKQEEQQLAESAAAVGALLLASAGYDEASAGAAPQRLHVAARAAHRALADARLGKRCSACGKQEGMGGPAEVAPLKRCAACHRDWYCGAACQRQAWKGALHHKEICPTIADGGLRKQRAMEAQAKAAAAAAAAGGGGSVGDKAAAAVAMEE